MADLENHNEHIETQEAAPDTQQTTEAVVAPEPRTMIEHIQDMAAESILDGRVLGALAELASFKDQATLVLDTNAKHVIHVIGDLGALAERVDALVAKIDDLVADVALTVPKLQQRITDLEAAATQPTAKTKAGATS
jgi:hypothetical protein